MEKVNSRKEPAKLDFQVAEKLKTLTLKIDLQTLAEFNVAAQVFRARSVASFLHEYVIGRIVEARRMVSAEEFNSLVETEKRHIVQRSESKAQTYRSGVRTTTLSFGKKEQEKLRKSK